MNLIIVKRVTKQYIAIRFGVGFSPDFFRWVWVFWGIYPGIQTLTTSHCVKTTKSRCIAEQNSTNLAVPYSEQNFFSNISLQSMSIGIQPCAPTERDR